MAQRTLLSRLHAMLHIVRVAMTRYLGNRPWLAGVAGTLVAQYDDTHPAIRFEDRDYFQAQQRNPAAGLFFSHPFRSRVRDDKLSIALTRLSSCMPPRSRGAIARNRRSGTSVRRRRGRRRLARRGRRCKARVVFKWRWRGTDVVVIVVVAPAGFVITAYGPVRFDALEVTSIRLNRFDPPQLALMRLTLCTLRGAKPRNVIASCVSSRERGPVLTTAICPSAFAGKPTGKPRRCHASSPPRSARIRV